MGVFFKWNKSVAEIAREATGGEQTFLFMANEAKRLMDPYVPALNMDLSSKVRVYAEGNSGIVHYMSPSARYQHGGILMVSRITGSAWARHGESKVVTGKRLEYNKSKHVLATAEWEKAMMASRGADYTAAVQRYVNGGGL